MTGPITVARLPSFVTTSCPVLKLVEVKDDASVVDAPVGEPVKLLFLVDDLVSEPVKSLGLIGFFDPVMVGDPVIERVKPLVLVE